MDYSNFDLANSPGVASLQNPNPGILGDQTVRTLIDLTGVWNCDDGGWYYIRQLGTTVWWYGEHDANSPDWSNVMRGTISGSTINADWTDVPKGSIMQYGTLNLNIESNDRISAVSKTGGFAGSIWTRGDLSKIDGVSTTPINLPDFSNDFNAKGISKKPLDQLNPQPEPPKPQFYGM